MTQGRCMLSRHFTGHRFTFPSLPVCRSATGEEPFRPIIAVNDGRHQGTIPRGLVNVSTPIEAIRANLPHTPKIFSIEIPVVGVVLGPSLQTAR